MGNLSKESLRRLVALCALACWALLIYWPCLNGPFFFDDEHFIQKNRLIQSLDHWPELYTSTVTQGANIKGNFYRPNQQLAYALLYSHYGQSVTWPYHLVPILLHIGTGLMLFYWLRRLQLGDLAAFAGAALFLVHPVQTEAVCYISGLSDPLATFFIMLTLLLLSRLGPTTEAASANRFSQVLSLPAFIVLVVVALFSKESAVVVAPIFVVYVTSQCLKDRRKPTTNERIAITASLVLAVASVVAKFTVFKFSESAGLTDAANPYTESLQLRLTTFIAVLWDYAKLIIWPYHLHYEKPYTAYAGIDHARGLFGVSLVLLAMLPILFMRKMPRLALGVGMVGAAIAPFSGVVPLNAMFLEHWLYTPMLGLALIFALLVQRIYANNQNLRTIVVVGLLLIAGLATSRTMARAGDWANVEAFYLNEIAHANNPGRIYNNLGMFYADRGDREKAIQYYKLAADSDTGRMFAQPHHNLAMAYLAGGRPQDALSALQAALQVDHQFVFSLNVLKSYFTEMGDKVRASHVESAISTVNSGRTYDYKQFEQTVFNH